MSHASDKDFKRIYRPTVSLWAFAAMLFVAILYMELKPKPESYDDGGLVFYTHLQEGTEPLPVVETDIRKLIIERADETLEFKRTMNEWEIVKPLAWYAHPSTINEVLRRMCENRYSLRYTEQDDFDLKSMGLDTPRLVLTMVDLEGETYRLAIGDKLNEQDKQVYAYREDLKRVYVIDDAIARSEYTPMNRILRRESVKMFQSDLKALRITAWNQTYNLEKDKKSGRWSMDWAGGQLAENKKADRFIKTWMPNYTQIYDRQPESLAPYGLEDPAFRVSFIHEKKDTIELLIGAPPLNGADYLFARNSRFDTVFLLPLAFLDQFKFEAADLRDNLYIQKPKDYRGISHLDITNNEPSIDQYIVIDYVPQQRGLQITEMGRYSTRRIKEPEDLQGNNIVHPESHVKLENDFFDLQAIAYYPANDFNFKKYGLDRVFTRVKATLVNEQLQVLDEVNLRMSRGDFGEIYAYREDNNFIIRVHPDNKLFYIVRSPDNFRVTFLWAIPRNDLIWSIEIIGPEDTTIYTKQGAVNWFMNGIALGLEPLAKVFKNHLSLVAEVRDHIRQLIPYQTVRRKGETSPEDLKEFGLDPPLLKVRVGYGPMPLKSQDDLKYVNLWIGNRDDKDGDWYGSVDGGSSVVKIDATLVDRFIYKLRVMPKDVAKEAKTQTEDNQEKIKRYLKTVATEFKGLKSEQALPDTDGDKVGEYCDLFSLSKVSAQINFDEGLKETEDDIYYKDGYFVRVLLPSEFGGDVNDDEKHFAVIAWPEMIGVTGGKMYVIVEDGHLYSNANQDPRRLFNRRDDYGKDITFKLLFPSGEFEAVKLNRELFQRER